MKFCQDAHEKEFFAKLNSGNLSNLSSEILQYFPPRSKWERAHREIRARQKPHRQKYNDLRLTVKHLRNRKSPENLKWIKKQDDLIGEIQEKALKKALTCEMSLDSPKINPLAKDKTSSEYRIIAEYNASLVDSIIIRQCAKYLRRTFDAYFLDCSYAFRSPESGEPDTHHDAFERLADFWKENLKDKKHQAWIAECDIQGFFDIIDHEIIRSCYDEAVCELEQRHNIFIDERAHCVVDAYLNSYSYNEYGRTQAIAELRKRGCPEPVEAKVKDRDRTLGECLRPGIQYGVPQGGALSVFFANLILHKADVAVDEILKPHGGTAVYVRYCDDMVIASLNKEITTQAFDAYVEQLGKLKLKHHKPELFRAYSGTEKRGFWKAKTKEAYLWGDPRKYDGAIPWLAFVGYRLRYDGMVKVRPTSLKKEIEKQREIRKEFLRRINKTVQNGKTLRFSERELSASLEGRLRAAAIGKRPDFDLELGMDKSEFGWCVGFKNLALPHVSQAIAQGQLRHLDRGLNRQLALARKEIKKRSAQLNSKNNAEKKTRLKFFGKPRSYAGQLHPNNLVKTP